jgi:hypothetical protein
VSIKNNRILIYFSEFFGVDKSVIEDYGAVNISLINDLPLFIDPFLLFNSKDEDYQAIHAEIINYMLFLREEAEQNSNPSPAMLSSWYLFPEVKQTWLGFSLHGNSGRGMGHLFAKNLHKGLTSIFSDFGDEQVTQSSHIEKLCLISPQVGRDKISDFTTHFVKKYLLEYTSEFARSYINPELCREINVPNVTFNYQTKTWRSGKYLLPVFNNDYVLLTPADILTRDDTFISRNDMISNLVEIASSIENDTLRFQLNTYLREALYEKKGKKSKKKSKAERDALTIAFLNSHPEIIDYYIKYKEENSDDATSISQALVLDAKIIFNEQLSQLSLLLFEFTDYYKTEKDSYAATYNRVMYLKQVIENNDGYKFFYKDGEPIKRESDIQVMFRLLWFGSSYDVNREVNNGRGPVDYKISKGARGATLVEFKLASNSKLPQNIANQVEIYQDANRTNKAIKVILYFTDAELAKIEKVLSDLKLKSKNIILIDARNNKLSASNVKS